MDLPLLPELLLMASLSLLLAFFLARLISVATTAPSPSSSEDDRPLLHAAADRAAAAGAGSKEAGEGGSGEQREEEEPEEEQQQERSSAAPPVVEDSGLDDPRDVVSGGRWREVEIVGGPREVEPTELLSSGEGAGVLEPENPEAEQKELSGLSPDEAAGVPELENREAEQLGEKKGVREVHLTSAHEDEEQDKPKPNPPTDEDEVRTEEQDKRKPTPTEDEDVDIGTATAAVIPIPTPPPSEGPLPEDVRPSHPGLRAEAEAESSSAVPVQQVKAVKPEEGGSSSVGTEDDDDWEGIEASELRKLFAVAASFVASPAGIEAISKLPADVQLQLHGLHKAATEGPCFEAQPMPLKISARAKWHAWQKLGDMNPEIAMEQYITMLSEKVPGWMVEKPNEKSMECEPGDSSEQRQLLIETERKPEFN